MILGRVGFETRFQFHSGGRIILRVELSTLAVSDSVAIERVLRRLQILVYALYFARVSLNSG